MIGRHQFHGITDSQHWMLGYWKDTKREYKREHQVYNNRQIIYDFSTHVHPYAQVLLSELVRKDIAGMEALDTEANLRKAYFRAKYLGNKEPVAALDVLPEGTAVAVLAKNQGSGNTDEGLPVDNLDFEYARGAYAVYNWELFYHVPFTIAIHLSRNGRYEESRRWFHFIFDPTDGSDPSAGAKRFWKVKPFKIDQIEHVEATLTNLATGLDPDLREATVRAIGAWRDNPFRPHLVARTRPAAYMYATVMAYLDNLIDWGDALFRQDTRESINEAMQLYVLAANILGPRPQPVPSRGEARKETYATLRDRLDEFGNAAVDLVADLGFDLFPAPNESADDPRDVVLQSIGTSLYFCVPPNEKLTAYWDKVADRLFKIRNSLNLQGIFRQLPLFAPPIDPAMLARAVAAGVDVGAVIAGTYELAPVRCQVLLQKAMEIAQEVKSLGAQILSALEKKDGETLGVLRARHEANILSLTDTLKYSQWKEAEKNREGIEANISNAFQRWRYYQRLLGEDDATITTPDYDKLDPSALEGHSALPAEPDLPPRDIKVKMGSSFRDGGQKVSEREATELTLMESAQITNDVGTVLEGIGAALNLIPEFDANGSPLGVGVTIGMGGTKLGDLFHGLANVSRGAAGRIQHEATLAGKLAGYERREQEWNYQANAAAGELGALYRQYRAAEIREFIAKRDYENHQKQIAQSLDVLEFLTNEKNLLSGQARKTTTEEFYLWMKREAQGLHSRCFQFALEVAKKAERALQFELGDETASFVGGGYLAGREGFFAGEKLHLDLKRMELAFLERNSRDYEITRHVSLRDWFPLQLIDLRQTGACSITLPEALFDLDCPGHQYRRIKSVALSIPCVAGPYASLNCSLALNNSFMRTTGGDYGKDPFKNEGNYRSYAARVESIVTSSAQSDSGVFEPNLRDERYLPFEGSGVISSWELKLLSAPKPFDYETIADVILTIRYTARPGGDEAKSKDAATKWLEQHSTRVFSIKHEFPTEWASFRGSPGEPKRKASLRFKLGQEHFPYRMAECSKEARQLHLLFAKGDGGYVEFIQGGKPLGKQELKNEMSFSQKPFASTGDYELYFDSNHVDDLWLAVDWTKPP